MGLATARARQTGNGEYAEQGENGEYAAKPGGEAKPASGAHELCTNCPPWQRLAPAIARAMITSHEHDGCRVHQPRLGRTGEYAEGG